MPLVHAQPKANPQTITAKQAVRYARASMNTIYGQLRTAQRDLYRRVYQGRDYSVAEFFVELGKDGAELNAIMAGIVALVEAIHPGTIPSAQQAPPATIALKANGDGSVSVAIPSPSATITPSSPQPVEKL